MNRPTRRRSESGMEADPTKLGNVLDAVLDGLGGPTVASIVLIHERWTEIIGPEVAAYAWPTAVEEGVLRVRVQGPGWASHIRWAETEIIGRLDSLLGPGQVTSVVTRVTRGEPL